MRRVQTEQSGFSAFVPWMCGGVLTSSLKKHGLEMTNDAHVVLPGRSAEPHGAFNPRVTSSEIATCAAGFLSVLKRDFQGRWGKAFPAALVVLDKG